MKVINIEDCIDCPYGRMTHSGIYGSQIFCSFNNTNRVVGMSEPFVDLPIPDWCPLEDKISDR